MRSNGRSDTPGWRAHNPISATRSRGALFGPSASKHQAHRIAQRLELLIGRVEPAGRRQRGLARTAGAQHLGGALGRALHGVERRTLFVGQ
jgi:hypothetical protein